MQIPFIFSVHFSKGRGGGTLVFYKHLLFLLNIDRSFHLSDEILFVFLCFYSLFFLLFFLEFFFMLLKVMVPNDLLLKNSQNLQSYCPRVRKAFNRCSSKTIRNRDLKLLLMSSLHLEDSTIFYTERI